MKKSTAYKGLSFLFFVSVVSLICSCKSNKIAKSEAKANDLKILDTLYTQNNYHIDINVAYPFSTSATSQVANELLRNTGNNANRINVRGDGNYVEIQNDSVRGYLPFFGERRLNAGTYGGTDLAIQFEEPLKDLTKHINTSKSKLELKFTANQKGSDNENYRINLNIYPNKHVSVNITPVYRTFMRYDGRLEDFDDEE